MQQAYNIQRCDGKPTSVASQRTLRQRRSNWRRPSRSRRARRSVAPYLRHGACCIAHVAWCMGTVRMLQPYTCCNTLPQVAARHTLLQHITACCNTVQHAATQYMCSAVRTACCRCTTWRGSRTCAPMVRRRATCLTAVRLHRSGYAVSTHPVQPAAQGVPTAVRQGCTGLGTR